MLLAGVLIVWIRADAAEQPAGPFQQPQLVAKLDAPISALAASPDGKWLAIGAERKLGFWSLGEPPKQEGAVDQPDPVLCLAFSNDSATLYAGSADRRIHLWNVVKRERFRHLDAHNDRVYSVDVLGKDQLLSGSADGRVKRWDGSGKMIREFELPGGPIFGIAVDPRERTSAATGKAGTIWLHDTGADANPRTLVGHVGPVYALTFLRDGRQLVSAGADQTIRVWEVAARQESRQLSGHTAMVFALAADDDATRLVSGDRNGGLIVWDLATARPLAIHAVGSTVTAIAVPPGSDRAFVGTTNGELFAIPGGRTTGQR